MADISKIAVFVYRHSNPLFMRKRNKVGSVVKILHIERSIDPSKVEQWADINQIAIPQIKRTENHGKYIRIEFDHTVTDLGEAHKHGIELAKALHHVLDDRVEYEEMTFPAGFVPPAGLQ